VTETALAADAERRSKVPFGEVFRSGADVRISAILAPAIGRALKGEVCSEVRIQDAVGDTASTHGFETCTHRFH
jgi:hypothetical protein